MPAIAEYYDRIGRLSDLERLRMLRAFDDMVPAFRRAVRLQWTGS